ncbi:MAG TPA: hypothetical protein VFR35_16000 [Actinoplanes sp.]|nr:hypothetical protein [Actinoplanes sp.]
MTAQEQPDETLVSAACAALRPYRWRSFAPGLLARSVLAAWDRQRLGALLVTIPGAVVGSWERGEPADPTDERIEPLVAFLTSTCWNQLTARALCRRLLALADEAACEAAARDEAARDEAA